MNYFTIKQNFRFFYAKAKYNTWSKIFVLDSSNQLYCLYLDYMVPTRIIESFDFNEFTEKDYSYGDYQTLREVTLCDIEKVVLTKQDNWVLSYLEDRIKELDL